MKFLRALKAQAALDSYHAAVTVANLPLKSHGQKTIGELIEEGYNPKIETAMVGPDTIKEQVAAGILKANMAMAKVSPGTIAEAMMQLDSLGFAVTAAGGHLGTGNVPEINVTFQQFDADKFSAMMDYLAGTQKHKL